MSFLETNNIEDSFIEQINEYKSNKFVLAISGGVDSMVLYHLLIKFNIKFCVAHCNFLIREEDAKKDESFIKEISKRDGIISFIKHFDIRGIKKSDIQTKARDLRYEWFRRLLSENELDYILTGHNMDDNIETFFINLIRSTGLRGLIGMRALSNRVLRPLLNVPKKDIIKYAKSNNIQWREDKSNQELIYTRNKIRHNLIPQLAKINPNYLDSFAKLFYILGQEYNIYKSKINFDKDSIISNDKGLYRVDIDKLRGKTPLNVYVHDIFSPFGFNIKDIISILDSPSGKVLSSNKHILVKDRDYLFIKKREIYPEEEFFIEKGDRQIINPISLDISIVDKFDNTIDKSVAQFDFDKLKFPLHIRRWRSGDKFKPFGMNGSKKISKYLKDEKINLFDKGKIWVLLSNLDIIWVIGHRIDDRYRVTKETKLIYRIFSQN